MVRLKVGDLAGCLELDPPALSFDDIKAQFVKVDRIAFDLVKEPFKKETWKISPDRVVKFPDRNRVSFEVCGIPSKQGLFDFLPETVFGEPTNIWVGG